MRGLIELVVVAAFALGWGVIELVVLRLDKRRSEQADNKIQSAIRDERMGGFQTRSLHAELLVNEINKVGLKPTPTVGKD